VLNSKVVFLWLDTHILSKIYALKLSLFMNRTMADICLAKCQLDSEGTRECYSGTDFIPSFTDTLFQKLQLPLLNVYQKTMHF
jgi:hypothetical protein